MIDQITEDPLDLDEFDKNLPHTVTLLRTPSGARVYLVGTGHFSVESQNDVSKVTYFLNIDSFCCLFYVRSHKCY